MGINSEIRTEPLDFSLKALVMWFIHAAGNARAIQRLLHMTRVKFRHIFVLFSLSVYVLWPQESEVEIYSKET